MDTLYDDMYMKKHLGEYVLFQLEQGYDLPDIKSAFLDPFCEQPTLSLFTEIYIIFIVLLAFY